LSPDGEPNQRLKPSGKSPGRKTATAAPPRPEALVPPRHQGRSRRGRRQPEGTAPTLKRRKRGGWASPDLRPPWPVGKERTHAAHLHPASPTTTASQGGVKEAEPRPQTSAPRRLSRGLPSSTADPDPPWTWEEGLRQQASWSCARAPGRHKPQPPPSRASPVDRTAPPPPPRPARSEKKH
jgi:hypothetical protein